MNKAYEEVIVQGYIKSAFNTQEEDLITIADVPLDSHLAAILTHPKTAENMKRVLLQNNLQTIDNFVREFITNTDDEDFLPWLWVDDVSLSTRNSMDSLKFLAGYYDRAENHVASYSNAVKGVLLKIPQDLYDIFSRNREDTNSFLNTVNDALSEQYSQDLICCLVRWLGGLDLKTLKALGALLSLYGNGINIDLGALYGQFAGVINNAIRQALLLPLIRLVDEIFQEITQPIRNWLADEEGKWTLLFLCTPIDELVSILLQVIEELEQKLKELVIDYYKILRLEKRYLNLKIDFWWGKKRASRLARIVDFVIKAIDRGELCAEESSSTPSFSELQNFMGNSRVSPENGYHVDDDEKYPTKYNSFRQMQPLKEGDTIKETKTLSGMRIPKHQTLKEKDKEKFSFENCLQKIRKEDIVIVTRWMRNLDDQVKGEA